MRLVTGATRNAIRSSQAEWPADLRAVEQDDDVRYVISATMPSAALLLLGFG